MGPTVSAVNRQLCLCCEREVAQTLNKNMALAIYIHNSTLLYQVYQAIPSISLRGHEEDIKEGCESSVSRGIETAPYKGCEAVILGSLLRASCVLFHCFSL